MIVSVNDQAILFLLTVAIGASIGMFYDMFRISRRVVKHSKAMISIEDSIFWIASILVFFIMLYKKNYADLRAFTILGLVIGATIYFLVFSKYIIKVCVYIINAILYPIKKVLQLIFYPIRKIYKLIRKIVIMNLTFYKKWYIIVNKKAKRNFKNIRTKV